MRSRAWFSEESAAAGGGARRGAAVTRSQRRVPIMIGLGGDAGASRLLLVCESCCRKVELRWGNEWGMRVAVTSDSPIRVTSNQSGFNLPQFWVSRASKVGSAYQF